MNILDRFSAHLRDVLARSIQLASDLTNPNVEPIHLFFCLATQKGSVATEILSRFKLDTKLVEQAIARLPFTKDTDRVPTPNNLKPKVLTPLSAGTKAALEKAMIIAQENGHNYIGSEHLLAAVVELNNSIVTDVLRTANINAEDLDKQLETVLTNASQFPRITEVAEVAERIQENLGDMLHQEPAPILPETKKGGRKKESALDFFATNLTDPALQKNIDPVIGRDREIDRVIQIICRRTKNNPLLLGDPGVGKTAIVEGLAKRILEGKVPDLLLNKKIYAVDMGLLIAGTIYRGEFEGRLRQVIEEVSSNPDIIVFIDEIHNIVGTGSNQGTMDAANILKPALARGHMRCIGATTPTEFKKHIETDPALERRFQPIYAKEPTLDDTIKILAGIKKNYEAFHNVTITPEAVEAAAKLADRYITSKFQPDKSIDLLDETAAAKRLAAKVSSLNSKVLRIRQKLERTILEKEEAASTDRFKDAVDLKKQEEKLRAELKTLEAARRSKKVKSVGTVTAHDVVEQVAKMIGTNPSELLLDNAESLSGLGDRLKESVVGQDAVVDEVARVIRQAQLGLSNPDRPMASFLFVGESGVGKTELAKTIAKVLYHDKDALIKLDMSEFNEGFGVSKLLGSPAGYVGYKESNQFTDKLKLNPYSVVLFDEIDKAHKDVIKLLLQMLENGEITDSAGKKISLKHAILILTTSFGAEHATKGMLGFGGAAPDAAANKRRVTEKLKEFFTPEVINRLDRVCLFETLTPAALRQIAALELERLNTQLKRYHTTLVSGQSVFDWVVSQLQTTKSGARDVRTLLRGHVEDLMAEIVLKNKIKSRYTLGVTDNRLVVK